MFAEVMRYLVTQNGRVEPLYELEKRAKLRRMHAGSTDGANSSEEQLLRGGELLGSIWLTAFPHRAGRPVPARAAGPRNTTAPAANSGLRLSGGGGARG